MLISIVFWFPFFIIGGYIAFATDINPTKKTAFIIFLTIILWIICYFLKRLVFKGKK